MLKRKHLVKHAFWQPRLTLVPRNYYNSLLGRPVDTIAQNNLISVATESIKYFHIDQGLNWGVSIAAGSIALRIVLSLSRAVIKRLKFKGLEERRGVRGAIEQIFMKDLNVDKKFYNINTYESQRMEKYYTPNEIIALGVNGFFLLNWTRALNHLSYHKHQYEGLEDELTKYDDSYILPGIVMICNYLLMSTNKHPFMITLRQPSNKIIRINISFMSGLMGLFFPKSYLISYISFSLTHMIIDVVYHKILEKRNARALKSYVLSKSQIREIENFCRTKT